MDMNCNLPEDFNEMSVETKRETLRGALSATLDPLLFDPELGTAQNNDIAFSVLQEVVADFLCTRFKHPYGVALNFGDELGVRIVANEARCAELNAHAVNPERSGK